MPETRTFRLFSELAYQVGGPSAFIMNVSAVADVAQKILSESFEVNPVSPVEESSSKIEEKRQHRFRAFAGPLRVTYRAEVEVTHQVGPGEGIGEVPPADLPASVVPYLYPSRYCESDLLLRLASKEFGQLQSGFSRVTGICNWIHDNVEYVRGTTNPMTSAYDTATERTGVCRDFAHLAIAFCRALAIPARFVAGYALDLTPPDFHACFEAWLGNRWYFFDPTRLVPQTGFVRIGTGRDAADTSFATLFGPVTFNSMQVQMQLLAGPFAQFTTDAVSL
jgi:transglutaminase-like putative cysteine protease